MPKDSDGKAKWCEPSPVFDVSLEFEPTANAEERLLMVYEILLNMDEEKAEETT